MTDTNTEATTENTQVNTGSSTDTTSTDPTELVSIAKPKSSDTTLNTPSTDTTSTEENLGAYETFGNETLDSIVAILKESKIHAKTAGELFKSVVDSGDPSQLDTKKLTELVGKDKAVLISAGIKSFYDNEMKQSKAKTDAVYDVLGSKENWETVRAWAANLRTTDPAFNAKADTINSMLQLSEHSARMAAKELKSMYESAEGNKSLGVIMTEGDKPGSQQPVQRLSRAEYNTALKQAMAKRDDAEIQRLRAIRAATLAAEA